MARVTPDTPMARSKMTLNDVPVRFDCDAHTYTMLDGTVLSGITGLLKERLFPTQYAGVDPEVLNNAAAYGSAVHRMCEAYDTVGAYPDNEDLHAYVGVKNEYELEHLCSEYLVTDCEKYASCIDKVYEVDENTVDLADIKTTYSLNKEYVSWQLSIYAYLLEQQNPHVKVRSLYAIHIRDGKGKLVEVQRKDAEVVKELLYGGDIPDYNPYTMPSKYRDMEDEIVRAAHLAKHYTDRVNELKAQLLADMERVKASRWESDRVQIVRREGSRTKKFDAKKFEAEHADMYEEYVTESVTKSSITIKIKGE